MYCNIVRVTTTGSGSQPPAVETRYLSSLVKITVIFLGQLREYIEIDFSYDRGTLRLQSFIRC